MSQFKIAFFGTPDFAVPCLQKLIEDEHFDVVGVVTQPDRPAGRKLKVQPSPVKSLAIQHNLPVLTPDKVNQNLEEIKKWQPEAAVVVAFGQILSQDFLDLFQGKVVNVHASLLPRWRGAAPIQRAIMAGDSESGVSLQIVVHKLDAGPVLGQRRCPIEADLTGPELYDRLKLMGPELIETELADWLRGHLSAAEQSEPLVTIAPKIKKEEGLITFSQSAVEIYNKYRGLYGWPGSWIVRNQKQIKIKKCRLSPTQRNGKPGTVLEVTPQSLTVACAVGAIDIFEVQPESKATMPVSEYLKGNPIKVGENL